MLSYVYDSGMRRARRARRRRGAARAAGQRPRPDHVHLGRRDGVGPRRLRPPGVPRRGRRGRRRRRLGHLGRHRELPARREDGARRLALGAAPGTPARAAHRRADHRARRLPQGGRVPRARARPRAGRSGDGHADAGRDRGAARRRRRARRAQRPVVPVRDASTRSPTSPRSAAPRGIALHVDACIGGFALAFWPDELPAWDLAVPGVTSLSADLHKYGYAPKGVSVLLTRGRDRQRHQYFATTGWPGYPVVNPTMAGSKPAGPLAAAWAITEALGEAGFAELTARAARATAALRDVVDGIEGLRVVGDPTGPLLAVATDDGVPAERRVDPHHWADAARAAGLAPAAAARARPGRRHAPAAHDPPHGHAGDGGRGPRARGGPRRRRRRGARRAAGRRPRARRRTRRHSFPVARRRSPRHPRGSTPTTAAGAARRLRAARRRRGRRARCPIGSRPCSPSSRRCPAR